MVLPLPVPPFELVMVTQGTVLPLVQVQPGPAVMLIVPLPPAAGNAWPPGFSDVTHPEGAP